MNTSWQWLVVGACVIASVVHLSLQAWPEWPARARRALVLRLLRGAVHGWCYRLGRRLAPPARIVLKPDAASACQGCSGCSRD